MSKFSIRFYKLLVLVIILLNSAKTFAQIETIKSGSFIVNMGVVPQTVGNALKPYGMIYDLMRNNNVPVKWVINQAKVKDGVDFTFNGVQYKGGIFIIPAEYRSGAVNAKITSWTGQGVVGVNTTSDFSVNVTITLKSIPRWTLDAKNGSIAQAFLTNAGITLTAFPGAYNWKLPATLDCCDDFFVMPHADPIWSTHGNLWTWNKNCLGSIWLGCHAGSALSNMVNPANRTQQTNFLVQKDPAFTGTSGNYSNSNSMILWGSHSGGSIPYKHQLVSDQVAQYLGSTDAAHLNGSEQIYMPRQGSLAKWNPGVKIIAYDPTQINVPILNPDLSNAAAVIAYGRGFDDPTRGFVMYEAAHNIGGTAPANVAAQRVFLNFSFFQVQPKAPQLSFTGITGGQIISTTGGTVPVSVLATSPLTGITFTYQWSSGCGGTFGNPNSANTTFNPATSTVGNCVISCVVTDNCGRKSFQSFPVIITAGPQPPVANIDNASVSVTCGAGTPVVVNVLANDTDPTGLPLTLTNVTGAVNGTVSFTGTGNVTFTPSANFTGPLALIYTVCNTAPLCTNGTLNITLTGASTPATSADAYTIAEDAIGTFNVLANDAVGLSVSAITAGPANGKVSINTDNTITYVPNADFGGPSDNFTYKVTNAAGGTNTAVVTVTVTNDACDAGTFQIAPPSSGTTTYRMSNFPVAPTTFGDAMLSQAATALKNWGVNNRLELANANGSASRILVKFNLSTLPANAIITSAQLRLELQGGDNNSVSVGAYGVNSNWNQGTLDNAINTLASNGATWVSRNYSANWVTPGGDFNPTEEATQIVTNNNGGNVSGAVYGWTITNTLAQSWYNSPATNYGLLLKEVAEAINNNKVFYSLEEGTATRRPVLVVNYTIAGVPQPVSTLVTISDTWINKNIAENVFGNSTSNNQFQVNAQGGTSNNADRLLFKFDLSAPTTGVTVPANSTITASTLTLTRTGGDNTAINIDVHQANSTWNEANGNNTANTLPLNGATWNFRNFTNLWSAPGGDYNPTPVSTQSVLATGVYNWTVTGIVQNWFNPVPSVNNGFLVKAQNENQINEQHEFASRESGTSTQRPLLSINYITPPTCAAIPARAPLALPDTANTPNGVAVNFPTATNDFYPVAGARTYTIETAPASGTGTINATTGVITYTPTTTFNGIRSFTYRVTHTASSLFDIATVYVNITNGQIVANNDNPAGALSSTVQTVNVRANDTDPEIASLNNTYPVTIVTQPANGTATVDVSGNVVYTPNTGFTGTDVVTYQVCEPMPTCGSPLCNTATVTFTVLNRAPTATNDGKTILPCLANTINLIGNDTDPENGILTVTNVSAVSPVGGGTLVNNNDGTVSFTPANPFVTPVTFTYTVSDNGVTPLISAPATVTLTVAAPPVNSAPNAINDAEIMNMDETNYSSVRDNDSDPNGDDLRIPTIALQPLHGTAVVLANGLIQYFPNPGYFGTDVLTYQVCDSARSAATCAVATPLCATATVTYTIEVPNTVNAVNDENSTSVNTPVSGGVTANDNDIEGNAIIFTGFIDGSGNANTSGSITVSGVDANGNAVANAGTLTINANGNYAFTPANNFTGVVTVPYTIEDDNINPAKDLAYLRITVSPNPSFTNSIIANNDENTTYGAAVSGNVTTNDRDPQGNTFTVTGFTYDTDGDLTTPNVAGTVGTAVVIGGNTTTGAPVTNAGTLTLNANGTYTFTPAADFHGSVDVPYSICDQGVTPQACQTALLHIDVLPDINGPANDPPVAGDDFNVTNVNTPVGGSFINNDNDPNGNPVSLNGITINTGGSKTPIGSPVSTAKAGTVQYYADGTYLYTPAAGYIGPDSIGYTICDVTVVAPQPLCTKALLHFLIAVDNSTDAINDETSTWQDVNVSGGVLENDFDKENNIQTFGSFLAQGITPGAPIASGAIVSGVNKAGGPVANAGVLIFAANGTYTFDPDPAFTGTVSIPYRLCDNGNLGKCDTAYLTITVDPLPTTGINTVIANNDENISYGLTVGGSLFVNDRDPQNDAFTVTGFTGGTVGTAGTVAGADQYGNPVANAGTLTINANGVYTFTPAVGFVGSINVSYTITDANGATSTAVLKIDVIKDPNGSQNDPPFAGDDFGYTTINKPVNGNFISNDSDPNNNPVSLNGTTINTAGPATPIGAPVATAQGGTVQFYSNGTYLYTAPVGYVGPDRVNYNICDVTVIAPQPLCADATIHFLVGPGIGIAGKVWNDANGDVIDAGASEPKTNVGGTLYVNLVDGSGNVVATTPVASNGSYSFVNVNPGVNYSIQLTTNQGTVGQPAPLVALPAGWVNTGETRNGTIDGGTAGVIDSRNYGYTNTINFDFGIEQLPETDNATTVIAPPSVGQFITLNGGANPPILRGSDPEDQPLSGVLTNKVIKITTLPTNTELYYNGVLVTAGAVINNFNPNLFQIKFTSATVGTFTTSFTFAYIDAAGKADPTPATYTLNWTGVLAVKFLHFNVSKVKSTSVLNFSIADNAIGSVFTVERSVDGSIFNSLGNIAGSSNSNYIFNDLHPILDSKNYYRIKEADQTNKINYSIIRMVQFTNTGLVQIYPLPAVNSITLSIDDVLLNKVLVVTIYNNQGQTVYNKSIKSATSKEVLDVTRLVSGSYHLSIRSSNEAITEKNILIIK